MTLGGVGTPILLLDMHVRVLNASLDGRSAAVRLRVRNPSDEDKSLLSRQLFLMVGDDKVTSQPVPPAEIAARKGLTSTRRFPLTDAQAEQAGRTGVEVSVVPFGVPQQDPDRLVVVPVDALG